jgi:hypothetical protein
MGCPNWIITYKAIQKLEGQIFGKQLGNISKSIVATYNCMGGLLVKQTSFNNCF